MNAVVDPVAVASTAVQVAIVSGDLAPLSPMQKREAYLWLCEAAGLNPVTRPFEWMKTRDGKLQLYPTKSCTDQLRKNNAITLQVIGQNIDKEGLLTVHVRATDKNGRSDEDFGVVAVAGLRGVAAANERMKAITKAKRRTTLSICGLGMLDESELEGIAGLRRISEDEALAEPTTPSDPVSASAPTSTRDPRQGSAPPIDRVPRRTSEPTLARDPRGQSEPEPASAPTSQSEPTASRDPSPSSDEAAPYTILLDPKMTEVASWTDWATTLLGACRKATSADKIKEWIAANDTNISALAEYDAEKYERLMEKLDHQIAIREEQATG